MKRSTPPQPRRPRNPVIWSPLLRKGGPHQRGRGGERQLAKRDLERKLRGDDDRQPRR